MNQRGKPPARTIVALALIILLGVVTVAGAVTVFQLPDPVTEEAERTDTLYQPVLAVSFVVFFGVTAGIIWAMLRYKRQSEDEPLPVQVHGSSALEATWTIIPIIILAALFIPSLILVLDLKNPPDSEDIDIEIEAVGRQWFWEFRYEEANVCIGPRPDHTCDKQPLPPADYEDFEPPTLVLPVGAEVVIHLSSPDVVHSFSAPQTLYKMQAIPGNINTMHMTFEKTGVFTGQCFQFCGLRHADMLFLIDVREQADYEAWLAETQAAQGVDPAKLAATSED
jgi:cytochrome c oxidase subunit 2